MKIRCYPSVRFFFGRWEALLYLADTSPRYSPQGWMQGRVERQAIYEKSSSVTMPV